MRKRERPDTGWKDIKHLGDRWVHFMSWGVGAEFTPEYLESFKIRHAHANDFATGNLLLKTVIRFLGAQDYGENYLIPLNWWQHFKSQCFPQWLLDFFPVKGKNVRTTVHIVHYKSSEKEIERLKSGLGPMPEKTK